MTDRVVWTDAGAHRETGTRVVWTDAGAQNETVSVAPPAGNFFSFNPPLHATHPPMSGGMQG